MIDPLHAKVSTLPGCIVFPPATAEAIITVNAFMNSHNLALVPEEYQHFLKLGDGMSFDGIEFFGTQPQQRLEKKYIFPDLIQMAKPYIKYEYFYRKLVIGRLSETIILYDAVQNIYALIDRVNLRTHLELHSFEELFTYLMRISHINL